MSKLRIVFPPVKVQELIDLILGATIHTSISAKHEPAPWDPSTPPSEVVIPAENMAAQLPCDIWSTIVSAAHELETLLGKWDGNAESEMLTLVSNDQGDWVGLYGDDGQLIDQGHSFDTSQLLELAGVDHDVISEVDLSDTGVLPQSLSDVAELPPQWKPLRLVRRERKP